MAYSAPSSCLPRRCRPTARVARQQRIASSPHQRRGSSASPHRSRAEQKGLSRLQDLVSGHTFYGLRVVMAQDKALWGFNPQRGLVSMTSRLVYGSAGQDEVGSTNTSPCLSGVTYYK
ncbi:unnamed protein product [Gadus morhua 'NCC']